MIASVTPEQRHVSPATLTVGPRAVVMIGLLLGVAVVGQLAPARGAEQALPGWTEVFGQERSAETDVIHLRDGTKLQGQVLNESFTIHTPYGMVTIPVSRCAGVSNLRASGNTETIITVNGNRLSGLISDGTIRFRTSSGTSADMRRERADLILLKRRGDERGFLRNTNADLFVARNGDLLTGRIVEPVLKVRTAKDEVALAVADIQEMGGSAETNRTALFLKRDGNLLEGRLVTDEITLELDSGATLTTTYAGRFAWAFLGNGYAQLARFANTTRPLAELLRSSETLALEGSFAGEKVVNSLGMEFRRVSPGGFRMGWDEGELGEQPAHDVKLTRPFYLGIHEVTQGHFQRIIGRNPSYSKSTNWPVEMVSWDEADEFCKKLTEMERAAGWLAQNRTYRLPTEAEWEYACRAGSTNLFSFGNDLAGLKGREWFKETSNGHPHTVGSGSPNAWGFYDMHGNVAEWCLDWYAPYSRAEAVDPVGPSSGTDRVFRGGSWRSTADSCRSALREKRDPPDRMDNRGFRVVVSAVP